MNGLLVIALCSIFFFFGRLVQQSEFLPDPAVLHSEAVQPAYGKGRTLKAVSLDGTRSSSASLGKALLETQQHQGVDVYNFTAWEAQVQADLERRKPLLPPGESGENFTRTMSFQILSWYPRIMVFPNFIDRARAEVIIQAAKAQMYPSGLALRSGEKYDEMKDVRTSTGTFLTKHGNPTLDWLEKRVAAVSFIPQGNGEAWNILNYRYSQHYDSHMDSFDPKEYGPQPSQRIATVIVYLSDVEGGGQTVFKREGSKNANKAITNWTSCDVDGGLVYQPRMGDAVLFWSVRPDGEIDPHSLHGSCPVTKGDKWIAVKWIRSKGAY